MHPCTYTSQVQCFVGLRPDHLHSISCPGGSATASGKQFENQCLHLSRVGLILLLSTTLCLFLLAFFLLSLYMEASNRTPGTKHVLDLTFLLILSPSYFQNRWVNRTCGGQSWQDVWRKQWRPWGAGYWPVPLRVVHGKWGLGMRRRPHTLLARFWAVSYQLFLFLWYIKCFGSYLVFHGMGFGGKSLEQLSIPFG